jgi:hypothetical protein
MKPNVLTLTGVVATVMLCALLGHSRMARTTPENLAAGISNTMLANAALSAAIATNVGG